MKDDDFYNWENMNLAGIVHLMVKWFDFPQVTIEVRDRPDVESRVWYDITIKRDDRSWYVSGQRLSIVRRRLIEFLDSLNTRGDYLIKKREDDERIGNIGKVPD